MSVLLLAATVLLIAAAYVAAIFRALHEFSPSLLRERLERDPAAAAWLARQLDHATQAVSLLLIVSRTSVFATVIMAVASDADGLTWTRLVFALVPAAVVVWLVSSVVTSAFARYAAESIVARSMPVIWATTMLFYPLTRAVAFVDEAVRRLTAGSRTLQDVAEAELLRSIEDTQREGGLDDDAAQMLENVVAFSSTDVGEVMTPRTDIEGIELTDDLAVIRSFAIGAGHSRIPVYKGNLDNIVGILYIKDLLPYLGETAGDFRLEPLLRQAIVVPDTKPVPQLLADFQRSEVHLAIVVDEYGGTAGLVTIEDVLEEIVGEIHDEHDPEDDEEPTIEVIEPTIAEVDGRYHIDDLNERLGLVLPEDDEYDTVGGFMLTALGRVPDVGDTLESHAVRFTALAATPTRVDRIRVEVLDRGGDAVKDDGINGNA